MAFETEEPLWKTGFEIHKKSIREGRKTEYSTSEQLLEKAAEYFQWCEEHPLYSAKTMVVDKLLDEHSVPLRRVMTIRAMCSFLGITTPTWVNYRKRPEFKEVTELVDDAIFNQKFEGAASGQFNVNLIMRDLGLSEHSKIQHTGADGGPLQMISTNMTPQEAAEAYAATLNSDDDAVEAEGGETSVDPE